MTAKEIPAVASRARVTQWCWRDFGIATVTRGRRPIFRAYYARTVDDAELKRSAWRAISVEFQRLIGHHDPGAGCSSAPTSSRARYRGSPRR